ncbi:thiaminase II [Pacificibacter marinus]|uniref:Aminopyrimidine aminohydrolase n=1 Tax=Pacificibacter marinus TaxID=658057 RepID=A0A1Y5RAW7_9RHOB|nr:thiaminase II [Pacificibacter marinus]SEK29247.1 thiaminase (transcriptional activator TenA) [Pacificibacter marinus]SLN10462.1 Thiaminase-2 [Pacificibacter marinus]
MSVADYGRVFATLRAGCSEDWAAYTHHRFVAGLCDGTLPRGGFVKYLVQDYVFLVHFARAWSLGVVKAETLDEMKICARTVDALVNHEMALHVKTCAAEGIDEEALFTAKEDVANLAYTRYVMDAGLQGDFLDLIAALAPCCFGYGEIGLRLADEAAVDTPYADWIKTYADADYQQVMVGIGQMFDAAVIRRLGADFAATPRWAALQKRFTTATQLEAGFWDMGLRAA